MAWWLLKQPAMRLLPSVVAASLLLSLATPALAGGPPGSIEPNVELVPATPTHVERYGKQIVVADLLWLGATSLVMSADTGGDGNLGSVLLLGYYATGPLVHLKHGNRSGAAKSLAARALLPIGGMLAGGVLAANASDDDPNDDTFDDGDMAFLGGMVLGAMVGTVTAVVLDWTVFSKKTVEGRPASWAIAPNVSVTPKGATVGLGGHF